MPLLQNLQMFRLGVKTFLDCQYNITTLQPSWLIPSIRRKFLPVFTREVSVSMTSWVVGLCAANSCRVCLSSQHRPGVVLTEVVEFGILYCWKMLILAFKSKILHKMTKLSAKCLQKVSIVAWAVHKLRVLFYVNL